jgi:hypothetical protein
VPIFLVNGSVAGTWRYEAGRIRTEPFDALSKALKTEVDAPDDAPLFQRGGQRLARKLRIRDRSPMYPEGAHWVCRPAIRSRVSTSGKDDRSSRN